MPRLEYVLQDMGRSLDDIAAFPQILTFNLDTTRRRHRYLKVFDRFDKCVAAVLPLGVLDGSAPLAAAAQCTC